MDEDGFSGDEFDHNIPPLGSAITTGRVGPDNGVIPGYVAPDIGLIKCLQDAWKEQLLLDYTIQVDHVEFRVHKIVMACVSDFFRAMLSGGMAESKLDRVKLEGLNSLAVSNIIEYVYTNGINGPRASPEDLLACAMYLQIPSAIEAATKMVNEKIENENCFDILNIFQTYSLKEAVVHTESYIKKNLADIIHVSTPKKVPYKYMDIFIDHWKGGEWDLFLAIKDWLDVDYEKRKQHLDSLLIKVQYQLLTRAEVETAMETKMYAEEGTWQERLQWGQDYRRQPMNKKMTTNARLRGEPTVMCFSNPPTKTVHILKEDGEWDTFDTPATTPDFKTAGVEITIEFNNFLIVCEGYSLSQKWYLFDPTTLTWSVMASMNDPRADFALVHDMEYVYAIGGRRGLGSDAGLVLNTVERYHVETNTWSFLPTTLPVPLYKHSACLCYDSSIYITGGREATYWNQDQFSKRLDCFNPWDDEITWQSKAPRQAGHQCLLMQQVGLRGNMHIFVLAATFRVQSYNMGTDQWTAYYKPTVQLPVWGENATLIADRRFDTFKFFILHAKYRPIQSNPDMVFDSFCARWTWDGNREDWDAQEMLQSFPISHRDSEQRLRKNYIAGFLSVSMPSHRTTNLEPPTSPSR